MTSAPAGWYADPANAYNGRDAVRYWDGAAWTDRRAEPDRIPAPDADRVEWLALVLAVVPLVGLVGGAVSLARGRRRSGALMIVIGAMSLLALQLLW